MGCLSYIVNDELTSNYKSPKLSYITKHTYEPHNNPLLHSHSFVEIIIVTSGKGYIQTLNENIPIATGDLVIINPEQLHTELNNSDDKPFIYYVIGIQSIFFTDTSISKYCLGNTFHELMQIISTIIENIDNKQDYQHIFLNQSFYNFLALLPNKSLITLFKEIETPKYSRECLIVKKYIDENYNEVLTLSDLSQLVFISNEYLIRQFKKYLNVSPMIYLKNKRLEQAKFLLENTDFSIFKVFQSTGFSTQSYFCQTFKDAIGVSPTRYRLLHTKNIKR